MSDNFRIDMGTMPGPIRDGSPDVGDVFVVQGGPGNGKRFRVAIAVREGTVFCVIVDSNGDVVGADRCADHYLERKGRVGFCDLSLLSQIKVEWL